MLEYKLNNPNFTIYHRAALGGFAATIQAWGANQPEGINAKVEQDRVQIDWNNELTDQEALRLILAASFKLTEDKLIDLPGQFIGLDTAELRLAIHEVCVSLSCNTIKCALVKNHLGTFP